MYTKTGQQSDNLSDKFQIVQPFIYEGGARKGRPCGREPRNILFEPRETLFHPRGILFEPRERLFLFKLFLQICIDLINTKLNLKNLDVREQKRYFIIIGICLGALEVLNVQMGGKEMGGMIVGKGEKEGEERRRKGKERKREGG